MACLTVGASCSARARIASPVASGRPSERARSRSSATARRTAGMPPAASRSAMGRCSGARLAIKASRCVDPGFEARRRTARLGFRAVLDARAAGCRASVRLRSPLGAAGRREPAGAPGRRSPPASPGRRSPAGPPGRRSPDGPPGRRSPPELPGRPCARASCSRRERLPARARGGAPPAAGERRATAARRAPARLAVTGRPAVPRAGSVAAPGTVEKVAAIAAPASPALGEENRRDGRYRLGGAEQLDPPGGDRLFLRRQNRQDRDPVDLDLGLDSQDVTDFGAVGEDFARR